MLQIYNTLTKQKEEFKPIHPGKINIYVCGITVYDYCHVGHGRMMVVFDMVTRYLRHLKYDVNYVKNITDIDDKIIKRANENKEDYKKLTERFIDAMHEDERALNILPPDQEPRATVFIEQIIALIQDLINKKFAYVADNGDVYFAVNKFPTYGELAHQDLEKLRSGTRVAITDAKHDPLDFVLWKLSKPDEPQWNSPWGAGRPGWHIECSAMALHCLDKHIDIHGGGFDLVFPHHQNEVAQAEASTGCRFVNVWMHNGFIQINKEKMSKSLGNFFTLRDVFKEYSPEVVRYFMLASHYRSPLNYSVELLNQAQAALERLYMCVRDLFVTKSEDNAVKNIFLKQFYKTMRDDSDVLEELVVLFDYPARKIKCLRDLYVTNAVENIFSEQFHEAMQDDFNTSKALAVLFDLAREINRLRQKNEMQEAHELAVQLYHLGGILGLLQKDPEEFFEGNYRVFLIFLYSILGNLRVIKSEDRVVENDFSEQFHKAMQDDSNIPEALVVLCRLAREINRLCQENEMQGARELAVQLRHLGGILGLLQKNPEKFLKENHYAQDIDSSKVDVLIEERNKARDEKDWKKADEIRAKLEKMYVQIEDTPNGTIWRYSSRRLIEINKKLATMTVTSGHFIGNKKN